MSDDKEDYYAPQKIERTRRITGYLVGDKSRFCDAKAKEEEDRVKHGMANTTEDEDTT